jgi:hypothetical protein
MVDRVEVRERNRRIDVRVSKGPAGPSGTADPDVLGYVHHQAVAATLWVIEHELSFAPSITVVDSSGRVVVTEVTYVSPTEIHVETTAPFSGTAYLS